MHNRGENAPAMIVAAWWFFAIKLHARRRAAVPLSPVHGPGCGRRSGRARDFDLGPKSGGFAVWVVIDTALG